MSRDERNTHWSNLSASIARLPGLQAAASRKEHTFGADSATTRETLESLATEAQAVADAARALLADEGTAAPQITGREALARQRRALVGLGASTRRP